MTTAASTTATTTTWFFLNINLSVCLVIFMIIVIDSCRYFPYNNDAIVAITAAAKVCV